MKSLAQYIKSPALEAVEKVVVRMAGDSGDGIQLLGQEWTKGCAIAQNDLATLPEYPAEIRAPAGTLAGVSGFQIQFSSDRLFTAGDAPHVLIAMNPAALKVNMLEVVKGGLIIVNVANFTDVYLKKAGLLANPLDDPLLNDLTVLQIDMNGILKEALKDSEIGTREINKCKNFFALGLLYWLYSRLTSQQELWIKGQFEKNPGLGSANLLAFRSGFLYGENTESMPAQKVVQKAPLKPGTYRTLTGNRAIALGLVTAAHKANIPLFYASYPITPASDILHELSHLRHMNVSTYQVEDEMAAIGASIGASYGGNLAVTATSGPGFALKSEALGYACMLEIPLLVIDVQRAGPSTGMPTKPEQADLLQALFGRSGEAPMPVIAAFGPADCFTATIEACRLAIRYMTPVILLSDAHIANSSEPWQIPDPEHIAPIEANFLLHKENFEPYERDAKTLARAWVLPGTAGLAHQLGGLEKDAQSGQISYDAHNHEKMVKLRALKVASVETEFAPYELCGKDGGEILVIGFGSTYGAIRQAVLSLQKEGVQVSHLHLRLLHPLPRDLGSLLRSFKTVCVAEMNLGQLAMLLRAQYLIDVKALNKVQGKPFLAKEIYEGITALSASAMRVCQKEAQR